MTRAQRDGESLSGNALMVADCCSSSYLSFLPSSLLHPRNDKILLALLPFQRDRLTVHGKVLQLCFG